MGDSDAETIKASVVELPAVEVSLEDLESSFNEELRATPVERLTPAATLRPSPSPYLFWEGTPQERVTYALSFMEGPLAGDVISLTEDTLHLGELESNTTLRLIAGALVIRDNGVQGGTYVALQNEEQILSGTCIRAGNTEYRYERVQDDSTRECFHFLHELGGADIPRRTLAIRDGLCSVGQDESNHSRPDDARVAPIHFEMTCGPWATYLADRSGPHQGTFLRLEMGEPWPLESGQTVRSGEHLFRVQRVSVD